MSREPYTLDASAGLFQATCRVIPGGVGSNDRALVAPHPIFISHGKGSHLWDVDGNEYVDFLLGYGPLVLGHAHPAIVDAVTAQLHRGSMYGASHPLEPEIAERLVELMPGFEMVRFGQSGTEAVLAAMRLARAATGRRFIVKFEGHYHGWSDQVAVSYAPTLPDAGDADRPASVPMSMGQPDSVLGDLIVLGWNDAAAVERLFEERGEEIACVLTEPIACNMGVIEPVPGYLERLRELCDRFGAVLIFDEVQTGVRVHLRGAQGLLGITPDLTCMGKALSGGFPVSAVGGRADIMELIADRRVFHAGTYNTNPLGLAAVGAVLAVLAEPGVFEEMGRLSLKLREGLAVVVDGAGGHVQGTTTVFGVAFGEGPFLSMRDGWRQDLDLMMDFKRELRVRGIYTKPTPRDIWYVSTEHTDEDIEMALDVSADAMRALQRKV